MRGWLILCLIALSAHGHEVSQSFLRLEKSGAGLAGRWEVSLQDLEIVIGLDGNVDDQVTRSELNDASPKVRRLLERSLQFGSASPECVAQEVVHRGGEPYLAITFRVRQSEIDTLRYDFMFAYDRRHRALVYFRSDRDATTVLTAEIPSCSLETAAASSGFIAFVRQGVIHIWEGTDHILFLLALLLPAVLRREGENGSAREAFWRVIKIVTAFTVAHSITLALAAIGVVRFPSRIVESVIAISVLLAAANNIARIWDDASWLLAFGFGLIHGFGFATVMSELELRPASMFAGLFGFNAGVELGQLAIVAVFFPAAYFLRETWFYRRFTLGGGSLAIMLIAGAWTLERAFSIAIFPPESNLPL